MVKAAGELVTYSSAEAGGALGQCRAAIGRRPIAPPRYAAAAVTGSNSTAHGRFSNDTQAAKGPAPAGCGDTSDKVAGYASSQALQLASDEHAGDACTCRRRVTPANEPLAEGGGVAGDEGGLKSAWPAAHASTATAGALDPASNTLMVAKPNSCRKIWKNQKSELSTNHSKITLPRAVNVAG